MTKKVKKRLTLDERLCIEACLRQGYSCGDIAQLLGRWQAGIAREVKANGGRDVYSAHTAQYRTNELIKQAAIIRQNRIGQDPKSGGYQSFRQRIESLEMQVEILMDQIKELKNGQK